ncbi:fungal-specific transcription factor domain-containing protein [Aspergillus pseudonomiae]|uniref:Fungal-specific transcription factor domain-containing protein n=1 Tax=Aspergillus pseudonomiae TaxID=1506151 RepID=A0A5N7D6V3_9EURO|nr:fungal-specific transcription factor domain-containing protein [Aspergillus pseudonomiae]KAB8256335.1 fungal-specific transcription factor domain-containing protein [Aspergillus pseudonomiae]KAE8402065.1 fungal-specific transcription factor domain-containing protein [Aspergillus pseudonomiae]
MKTHKRTRRLFAACYRCHSQKVKCSGEHPCRSCAQANKSDECRFPPRERKVTISEHYLRRLEADSKRLQTLLKNESSKEHRVEAATEHEPDSLSQEEHGIVNPLFETQKEWTRDKQTEPGFTGEASCIAFGDRLLQCTNIGPTPSSATLSQYLSTKTANHILDDNEYTLPDRAQAKLLIKVAWRFIGNDHHLFLKVSFVREIEAVYQKASKPTVLWLCKLWTLLALGELYTNRRKFNDTHIIPGTNYYLQALNMLHDIYEEASLLHVEVLILIAWYSNSLGRIRSAYSYSGIAMRLALSLGLHRSGSAPTTASAVELESRRRTWWMLYYFERMSASKLGLPITLRDEDIDVELPSMDGLTEEEQQEFADPAHMCANVKLARITGNILAEIYCLPRRANGMFVQRVHSILKQLRAWNDALPPELCVRECRTPRPVASLHMAYNECIMQTTRPILLHLFRRRCQGDDKDLSPESPTLSPITALLADSCVNAAITSCRIMEGLFIEGSIATFGYWEAQHIFSSSLILIISALLNPSVATSDLLQTSINILRTIRDHGNIPAVDYSERLALIQAGVSSGTGAWDANSSLGRDQHTDQVQQVSRTRNHDQPSSSEKLSVPSSGGHSLVADFGMNCPDTLAHPLMDTFLDENLSAWSSSMFTNDNAWRNLATEMEEHFLF